MSKVWLCHSLSFFGDQLPYSWKFSRNLYFKNFVVQTKFVKYKTLKYSESITEILLIAKINYVLLDIANESKFVK